MVCDRRLECGELEGLLIDRELNFASSLNNKDNVPTARPREFLMDLRKTCIWIRSLCRDMWTSFFTY